MTRPARRTVKSRLQREALAGGGLTVRQALNGAKAGLAALHDEAQADIARRLAEIERLFGPKAGGRDKRELEDLYSLSHGVIAACACAGSPALQRAALALCDFVDHAIHWQTCDWPALDVHVEALALMTAEGDTLPEAEIERVLGGLSDVLRKCFGDPAAQPLVA